MRVVEVFGVRAQLPTNAPVVLLNEVGGNRLLPLWVGELEAAAIALAVEGVVPSRPLTHDLVLTLMAAIGERRINRVEIISLTDGVFLAELVLDDGRRVDCRASDGIALALRCGAQILVADDVMDEAGVPAENEEPAGADTSDEDLARFREFLDTINPEDFRGSA